MTEEDRERARVALALTERPENSSNGRIHRRRIQFTSTEAVEKAGIEVEPVWSGPISEALAANGELTYDQAATTRLSARAPGTVVSAFKQVGDPVRAGEVVAVLDAAEVGKLKAELLQAMVHARLKAATLENLRSVEGVVPGRSVNEMAAAVREARSRVVAAEQALANLGLYIDSTQLEQVPDKELAAAVRLLGIPGAITDVVGRRSSTANSLPVVAPADGVMTARDVVAGEVVDTSKVLFVVTDTRRMWLNLSLREEDAGAVRHGQKVFFRPAGSKADVVGALSWMSTSVDSATRTLKVRATIENPDGRLRANTFGPGRVVLRDEPRAAVVPTAAVHFDGECYVVFVRDRNFLTPGAPKVFHTRTVRVGWRDEKTTEIIAGVLPGELVASKGSAGLRGELLRGSLGDGCGCGK